VANGTPNDIKDHVLLLPENFNMDWIPQLVHFLYVTKMNHELIYKMYGKFSMQTEDKMYGFSSVLRLYQNEKNPDSGHHTKNVP